MDYHLSEVKTQADLRMWPTGVLDGVDIVGTVVAEDVTVPRPIPHLPPHEVPKLLFRQPLLPCVVYPLYDCGPQTGLMQEIWDSRTVAKGIH